MPRDSWLPPRVLWNPHPGPGRGPSSPAPVGSGTPASSAAGPRTLHRGLRLPAPKAGLQGPGPGEGSGAAPSQGCAAWARSAGREPRLQRGLWLGAGSAGLRAAGRGGAEREGPAGRQAPSRSPLRVTQPETGRAGETLIPPRLPVQASIPPPFMRPSVHSYVRVHSAFMPPLARRSERTYCVLAGPGQLRRAAAQRGIPAPPLLAASPADEDDGTGTGHRGACTSRLAHLPTPFLSAPDPFPSYLLSPLPRWMVNGGRKRGARGAG